MRHIAIMLLVAIISCGREWDSPFDPNEGLVARYSFDGNANDISGNGRHGTVHGAVLTYDRFGKANRAYLLDGIDDYINTQHDYSWSVSESFSILLWFSTRNPDQKQVLIGKANWEYSWQISSNVMRFYYWLPNAECELKMAYNGGLSKTGTWHHTCVTYNGVTREGKFYFDGVMVASVRNIVSEFKNISDAMLIGYGYYGSSINYGFSGIIDDVRIYNRALAAYEIKKIFKLAYEYVPGILN